MSKNILLIEDDLDLQRIYSQKLEFSGFSVALAVDTEHGLTAINNSRPSLILLDIMLPGKMNGLEFIHYLKSDDKLKDIPVIIITNLDTQKDEAIKLGAVDCLIKVNTELNEIIEKATKYAK